MQINNRITELFNIKYPIIQGGMVWASGWKLASATSNEGGLGLIGAGSMKAELLKEHIQKCKAATDKPFGVNLPLFRGDIEDLIQVVIDEKVKIVFSSAGHPGKYIDKFKEHNMTVVHVVPSLKFAKKVEDSGCDAVVGEGTEAGGHNGLDEITTMSLIPQMADNLSIPVIAAGGIVDGRGILAALALGAEGVQMGTRFAVTKESGIHENYKQRVVEAKDNDTVLVLKKIGTVRMLKNSFSNAVIEAENSGAEKEKLMDLRGEKREMRGMFQGDLENGMMEAGQGSGLIKNIPSVKELFVQLISEYDSTLKKLTV
ncbi:MAG: nitronate monooxygenase [Melioribacteraceae bacterium]|nr:nitronate monooxygenase [Melioribacteraceae bacterium]